MKIRTLLVDSSYLLKRSFFGARKEYNAKFGHIGGLYSFMTSIRMLIKKHAINKVVLVWDGENGGIHRHRIDSQYKSNRKDKSWHKKIELTEAEIRKEQEKEESLLKQRKRIQAYAEELFIRQIEVEEIEADDIIAAYCIEYHEKEDVLLFTNDRDFAQLLDLDITILFGNIEEPVDKTNFFFELKYHYGNALPMKIICGDASDNIKGIHGISEKTLIKHFPRIQFTKMTVREICGEADKINKKRVEEGKKPFKALSNLLENIERLKTNYRLINLREPFLNDQAIEELEQLTMPLAPEGRSSKNLFQMMKEDDFLSSYSGGDFVNYIEPFYPVIQKEKSQYKKYYKSNKKLL